MQGTILGSATTTTLPRIRAYRVLLPMDILDVVEPPFWVRSIPAASVGAVFDLATNEKSMVSVQGFPVYVVVTDLPGKKYGSCQPITWIF